MYYRIFFTSLFWMLLSCVYSSAQTEKKIRVIGDFDYEKTDYLFVGELHYLRDRDSLLSSVTEFAYEKCNMRNVVLEIGHSAAQIINDYIQKNDSSIFFYNFKPTQLQVFEKWRSINRTLAPENQIRVYGIDFERMAFVKVLKNIFKKHDDARSTSLFKYVNSIPDSVCSYSSLERRHTKVRKRTYSKARHFFADDKDRLKELLKEDYEIVRSILENPCTERKFARRDKFMAMNLAKQIGTQRFICELGEHHTEITRKRSVFSRFIRQDSALEHKTALATVICRTSYHPGYIVKNNAVLSLAYNDYYSTAHFSLINEKHFGGLIENNNYNVSNYFIFFNYKID